MFIAHVKQPGGCDYTIACGETIWRLKARNKEDAIEELRHLILGEFDEEDGQYCEGYWNEQELGSVVLFEVANETDIPITSWYKEAEGLVASRRVAKEESKTRAMFELLKAKYGEDSGEGNIP